jgi:beta-galactosidase
MKNSAFRYIVAILTTIFLQGAFAQSGVRENFGKGWEFRMDSNEKWEKVNLPHTAKVEPLVVLEQFQGDCYYRKTFRVDRKDKKIFIYFEGIMQQAEVWINGKLITHHKGGYLPFTIDATDHLLPGTENNIIELKVNNQDDESFTPGKPIKDLDFNYYGGIYRNVYLITSDKLYITDPVHADKVAGGGIYASYSNITSDKANVRLDIDLQNDHNSAKDVQLKITLTNPRGKTSVAATSKSLRIPAGSAMTTTVDLSVKNPMLWSVEQPHLYQLNVEVVSNGKTVGKYTDRLGIRTAELRSDGFYLNNKKMYLEGTNRHQEYPYVGYALSDQAQYRDAVKIKNAGFDMVRLSHYPQAKAFLDACDELGLIVMNSLPGWQFFGNQTFQQHAIRDVQQMARRDRNHPGIVFWEVSLNESNMSDEFMQKAVETLKNELPHGNNITVGWMDHPAYDIFIPARQHAKAPDYWNKYEKNDRKIFIAEYGDWEYYAQNAGFNQTEYANLKEEERTSRQLRSAGEKRLLQQAYNFQEASNSNRRGRNTIGEANWLMFDYNRGYAPDIESSGISDIFRIPKFAYYFYQSQRDPDVKLPKKLASGPMVHIASYWNQNSPTDIRVFSNCEEVALYLNGELVSKQKPLKDLNSDMLKHPPFIFKMGNFTKGTLRADAYIGGKVVATHTVNTAGQPVGLRLRYDTSGHDISRETPDVLFVYAEIIDESGNIVTDSGLPVTFNVNGNSATLIGENPINAEAGTSTILLRTELHSDPITIQANAPGLNGATITIK